MAAGPIWDFERSMDSVDPRDDAWDYWQLNPNTDQGFAVDYWRFGWWGILAKDPEFRQAWIDRWQSLRTGVLADTALQARFDFYRSKVSAEAAARPTRRSRVWSMSPAGRL